MSETPNNQPVPKNRLTRSIQCPECRNIFQIGLANEGKDINFLNFVTWNCPRCKQSNITPFLSDAAS